jgi:hypothetical protein
LDVPKVKIPPPHIWAANRYFDFFNDFSEMLQEVQVAFQACEERKLDLLMTVVPQVIDPNSTVPLWDKNGIKITKAALMHIVAFSGSYDCVKYLIRCCADVGLMDVS